MINSKNLLRYIYFWRKPTGNAAITQRLSTFPFPCDNSVARITIVNHKLVACSSTSVSLSTGI